MASTPQSGGFFTPACSSSPARSRFGAGSPEQTARPARSNSVPSTPGGAPPTGTWGAPGSTRDPLYLSGLRPFVGEDLCQGSHGQRFMAPHPLSPLRRSMTQNAEVDMSTVWKLRRAGNFVMMNSASETFLPEAKSHGTATEFDSHAANAAARRKHRRSDVPPTEKYRLGHISSQAVGWRHETDLAKSMCRPSANGIKDSFNTKYFQNMKETHMENCLRLCR